MEKKETVACKRLILVSETWSTQTETRILRQVNDWTRFLKPEIVRNDDLQRDLDAVMIMYTAIEITRFDKIQTRILVCIKTYLYI